MEGEAKMSGLIGDRTTNNTLDEMVEVSRQRNRDVAEEEKLAAERKAKGLTEITDAEKPLEEKAMPEVVAPPTVKPNKRNTLGYTLKYIGVVLLIPTALVYTPLRACNESNEKTDYTSGCVAAKRAVGVWGNWINFEACSNGRRTITEFTKDGDSEYIMTDFGSNDIVDTVNEDGTLYTSPHPKIDEAQGQWKEDWEALDADEILKGWAEWKGRQR